jgi:hypothetical protein
MRRFPWWRRHGDFDHVDFTNNREYPGVILGARFDARFAGRPMKGQEKKATGFPMPKFFVPINRCQPFFRGLSSPKYRQLGDMDVFRTTQLISEFPCP